MRQLLVSELQTVNGGGSVYSDIGSMIKDGISHHDITVGMLGVTAGILIGGGLGTWAPFVAVGALATWTLTDLAMNSKAGVTTVSTNMVAAPAPSAPTIVPFSKGR